MQPLQEVTVVPEIAGESGTLVSFPLQPSPLNITFAWPLFANNALEVQFQGYTQAVNFFIGAYESQDSTQLIEGSTSTQGYYIFQKKFSPGSILYITTWGFPASGQPASYSFTYQIPTLGWGKPYETDGAKTARPPRSLTAVSRAGDLEFTLDFFWVDMSGTVGNMTRNYQTAFWSSTNMPGSQGQGGGDITAFSEGGGEKEIVCITSSGGLKGWYYTGGTWSERTDPLYTQPHIVSTTSGGSLSSEVMPGSWVRLWWVGPDGSLQTRQRTKGGQWTSEITPANESALSSLKGLSNTNCASQLMCLEERTVCFWDTAGELYIVNPVIKAPVINIKVSPAASSCSGIFATGNLFFYVTSNGELCCVSINRQSQSATPAQVILGQDSVDPSSRLAGYNGPGNGQLTIWYTAPSAQITRVQFASVTDFANPTKSIVSTVSDSNPVRFTYMLDDQKNIYTAWTSGGGIMQCDFMIN
ncbi:hypothetical protein ABW20_dc0103163 [Dactylellina cionopaga]|nr:hypothetical protein ABW20_dc0103163 [Dactylellina cionopaga]